MVVNGLPFVQPFTEKARRESDPDKQKMLQGVVVSRGGSSERHGSPPLAAGEGEDYSTGDCH